MSESQLISTPCVFGENGNFLLERELGSGGMGGVYLGRDKMLDRPVAVKVMLKEFGSDNGFVERFKKEAQAAARLIHPNIAQVYSYGISDEMPYIAMELVAGGSLYQVMRNSGANSDVPRIMKICEQVAQALRCAADQGLVHGDIKPENILLDANGNAKLVDFGLAAMQKDTDEIWGTPYYIAPEKVRKDPVDYRADIYSLGGTLYHALCGVAPFEGEDATAVVKKRFEVIPRKPSEVRPGLSPQIDALVMKMLAFNPADRYPTFEALLADFKAVMTVGLSQSQISASPSKESNSSSTGKKKLTLKPKKKLALKTTSSADEVVDATDEAGGESDANEKKSFKIKRNSSGAETGDGESNDYDDEEEGGNLGVKIALFVGIIVVAVVLVGGGLWYVTSQNKKNNEAKIALAIKKQIDVDISSLAKIRTEAEKAIKDADEVFDGVIKESETVTSKLKRLFEDSEESRFMAEIKPPKSKELVDAELALNPPAAESAPAQNTDVKATATNAVASAAAPVVDSEEASAPDSQASEIKVPRFVEEMKKHWNTTYSIMAKALLAKKQVIDIIKEINQNVAGVEYDESTKVRLMTMASSLKSRLDTVFSQLKEVKTETKKFKVSLGRFYRDVQSDEIKKQEVAKAKEIAEKKKKVEEERAKQEKEAQEALLTEETEKAKASFDTLVSGGALRRLYWEGAERELKALADSFKTPEARRRIYDVELKKVHMMKSVQDIFMSNMKANGGYVFATTAYKNKFLNKKVVTVDKDKIVLVNKNGKGPKTTVMWQAVYSDYPLIMNELWNKYIHKGRENGVKKLTLKEWSDAQIGFAMTLKLICSSVDGADQLSKLCAMEVVKKLPNYKSLAAETFPEIDFSAIEAEAAANDL